MEEGELLLPVGLEETPLSLPRVQRVSERTAEGAAEELRFFLCTKRQEERQSSPPLLQPPRGRASEQPCARRCRPGLTPSSGGAEGVRGHCSIQKNPLLGSCIHPTPRGRGASPGHHPQGALARCPAVVPRPQPLGVPSTAPAPPKPRCRQPPSALSGGGSQSRRRGLGTGRCPPPPPPHRGAAPHPAPRYRHRRGHGFN